MGGLTIYGVARSRAFRTLWMATELGLAYEHVPTDFAGGTHTPEFLRINPNGHVPAIDDDGLNLCESMAINLYLAKKHDLGGLYPTSLADEARAWQWGFWGMTEIEGKLLTAFLHRAILPEPKRDAAQGDAAETALAAPLGVLEGTLAKSAFLIGPRFTVADLNLASILSWARPARVELAAWPKAAAWLKGCLDRPAARAARELQR
jgi:glutathione S-transferase